MVAPSNPSETPKRALVIQPDAQTRNLIQEQLQNAGFWVDAFATPGEGKSGYQNHPLVFASVERHPSLPEGLIPWVRRIQTNPLEQPYIVAVGDNSTPFLTPMEEQLWDELLTLPLTHAEVRTRLQIIEPQLRLKTIPEEQQLPPERQPQPGEL